MGGWIDGWIHATVLFVYPEGNVDTFRCLCLIFASTYVPPLFLLLLNAG